MSNLEAHAEREMRRAGLYEAEADYGGMIPEAVMKLIRALASDGHSGGSHALVMKIFNRVANFHTLTPLTDSPDEWRVVGDKMWQNTRDSSFFSEDAGKTCYSVEDEQQVSRPTDRARKEAAPSLPPSAS